MTHTHSNDVIKSRLSPLVITEEAVEMSQNANVKFVRKTRVNTGIINTRNNYSSSNVVQDTSLCMTPWAKIRLLCMTPRGRIPHYA